ncbi:hypothetical protein ACQZ6S_19750 [Agrobacterium tumefaciens]
MSEDALKRFILAVQKHYEAAQAAPLLLSSFGQRNGALLKELKNEFGSLKAAVRAAGEQHIKFIDLTVGREAVAPAAIAAEIQLQLQEVSATQREAAANFDSLPNPLQIAFCVRTDAGEQVAVDIVPPFRFAKVTAPDLIRQTQRIIPDKYRRPGLSLQTATLEERATLWRLFLTWVEAEKLDAGTFHQAGNTTALARLIAAQPSDVIPRLVIPGDIVQLLLKHA